MSNSDFFSIEEFRSCYSDSGGEFPRLLSISDIENGFELNLEINEGLDGFRGHFPENPVLPGIVQLHWAATFASQLFGFPGVPPEIKQLKFKKVVQPPETLSLILIKAADLKVKFEFSSAGFSNSSGLMFYKLSAP